jgi:transposase
LEGKSVTQVQEEMGLSWDFIHKIREEVKENIPEPKSGRPTKVTKRTQAALASKMHAGDFSCLRDAQSYIQEVGEGHVCKRTIVRYLKAQGLTPRRKPEAPRLTDQQMRKRLDFAKAHVGWTVDDWRNVMFSDECSIMRIKPFGTQYFYANEEHKLRHRHHFKQKAQAGGDKIMVWGSITAHGIGDLCWVEGTMDAAYYVQLLQEYVIIGRDWYRMDPAKFIFQQDNASIHTASIVKNYLRRTKIKVIDWPPNSPDINPIERVWAFIKQRLDHYPSPPNSLQELFDRVEDIWTSVSKDYLANLYAELPSKMKMLVKTRGLHSIVPKGTARRHAE